jgi:protein-S-isoprenylcysteine O-methyltransferase Ste14
MPLVEEFERTGAWLFRWRSYLPLVLVVLLVVSLGSYTYPKGSHGLDRVWEVICIAISFSGVAFRALTAGYAPRGTSERCTRRQVAAELNTSGVYSMVRHPLYFGNFLIALGVFSFLRIWWLVLIYGLVFALYYERIMFAEEKFLREKFGDAYRSWAGVTPAFLPNPRKWRSPNLPFSWKAVLRREYRTPLYLVATMFVLELLTDLRAERRLVLDVMWISLFAGSLVFFLVIRLIQKRTRCLEVEGH